MVICSVHDYVYLADIPLHSNTFQDLKTDLWISSRYLTRTLTK